MNIPQLQVSLDNIFFKVIGAVRHHYLRYLIKYKRNIKNLKTQVKKLEDARERVQHAIDAANMNGEEIEADVLSWLSGVDNITKEAEKFFDEEGQAKMMGVDQRWFRNLKSRYQLSKKAAKMAHVIVAEIQNADKFNQVAYRPAPQGLTTVASSTFIAFESRTLTLKEIIEALKDSNINMIGVYGMSGVGKTALVKEVAIQAKEEKLFDVTIAVSVKQNPDPKRIQGEIADKLGMKFNEETVGGRADRLCFRIKKEKKILVILDDLWAKLDLEEVGVPFGDAHKGCKILLTSRTRDVLAVEMGTQKHFELIALSKEETWSLFEKVAGDDIRDANLETVAIEVANRCAGLPVVILTVARALKGKDLSIWKEKLKDLEKIDDNEGMEVKDKVYSALELSYNHLEGDEAKSVFLLCGLLPKYDIAIDYLSLCAMALGLFKHVDTLEEAKNRVHKWVDVLKGQCLLLDSETNKQVKMHDFVHDFAVLVASRDRHAYINDLPEKDILEKCTMISFPSKEIRELPEGLECSKLELIKLENTNGHMKIPETFFKGTKNLRVVDFSRMHLMSLPSLHFLGNLKMLRLHRCMFRDIAIVGELKRLEILLLTECDMHELPKEIGQLTCLRLLDLTGSSKLEVIPAGVILSLKNLEELYMGNSFAQWEVEELNSERANASLHELKHLSKLANLEVYIPDAKVFPKDLLLKKLERYVILIGVWLEWNNHMDETSRTLKLKLNPSLQLEDGIKTLLKKAESVYLDELNGVKSIMYELDNEGYKQLKHLHVQNNAGIQYIINSRERAYPCITFPVLESIFLKSLSNLEKICHGQLLEESFHNLRIVKVEHCHRFKYLLSVSAVPGGFLQLQELEINECRIMSAVFAEEREDQTDSAMDVMKFSELRSLTMQGLPKLMDFVSYMETPSTSSRSLFNQKVSFPKLEDLKLSSINLEKIWDENLQTSFFGFQNLTRLIVQSCGSLNYLLSSSNAKSLVQLNYLKICRCEVMEEVVVKNELGDEEGRLNKMFPKLEYLKLKDLPNLSRFCDGFGYLIEFQIKELWIENCSKLKTFISKSLSDNENTVGNEHEEMNSEENLHAIAAKQPLFNELAAFPNLEVIVISKMENLEMIWDNIQLTDQCTFCNLRYLSVTNCEKLPAIFPYNKLRGFQNIETLEVRNCHSLEEISTCPLNDVKEKYDEIAFNFKLEYLRLSNLPKLMHIFHDDFPGSYTFKNLRLMKVEECESLKHLIPASMAGDLVKSDDGGEAEEEISFNQLKYLKLRSLSNLTSFYSGKCSFKLPSLEEVVVEQCPKVNIPSLGLLSLRNAERVAIVKGDEMHGQISELDGERVKINSAATIIQRRFLTSTKHKEFNLLRVGVVILQSLCRVKLAIKQFELLKSEKNALAIQKNKVRYQARINNQERTYKDEKGETSLVKAERAKTNVKEATTHSSQTNSRSTKTLFEGTSKSCNEEDEDDDVVEVTLGTTLETIASNAPSPICTSQTSSQISQLIEVEEEEVTPVTSKLSHKKHTESYKEKSPKPSIPSSANELVKPAPPETTNSNAPSSDIEEDDMEAFYASVGAKSESCQPTSMDSTTHAQCNKSKPDQADIDNALELVNSVLATRFSSACDPGCSSYFKSSLELLCGLDEHDGISVGLKPLVLQLSKDFQMMAKRFDWANETIERHNKLIQSKVETKFQLNENKEKFLKFSLVEYEVEGQIKKLQQQINSLTEQRNLAKLEKRATFEDGKKLKDKLNEDVQKVGNVEKEKEIAEWIKEELEEKWSGFPRRV